MRKGEDQAKTLKQAMGNGLSLLLMPEEEIKSLIQSRRQRNRTNMDPPSKAKSEASIKTPQASSKPSREVMSEVHARRLEQMRTSAGNMGENSPLVKTWPGGYRFSTGKSSGK